MAAFFEEKHEKKERLSPKRVRSTHSFGEEVGIVFTKERKGSEKRVIRNVTYLL